MHAPVVSGTHSFLLGSCIPSGCQSHHDAGQTARPCHRTEQDPDEGVTGSREAGRSRWAQLRIWSDVLEMDDFEPRRPATSSPSVEGE